MSSELLGNLIERQARHYPGKYRAFVVDNRDPERRGRIRMRVPSVLGEAVTDWALPCFPYGGAPGEGWLAVPPLEAQVVAEFMEGDLSAPLWTGAFWRRPEEVPDEVTRDEPTLKFIKSASGHLLSFEDADEGEVITLRSAREAKLVLDQTGSIALTARDGATVTLDAEGGELTVADANGNEIRLSSAGLRATDAAGNAIETAASGIKVSSSATVTIEGAQVALAGTGGEPLLKGASFMSLFLGHTHAAAGGPTSPAVPPPGGPTPFDCLSMKTTSS